MRLKTAVLCLFTAYLSSFAEIRTWTLTGGKKVEAEFVSLLGENVSLKSRRGKVHKIPVNRFSGEDIQYIELRMPPDLEIDFSKVSKQRIFPNTPYSEPPRSFYFTFKTKIKQTSRRQYQHKLTAEMFSIGEEVYGGKNILLDYQKSDFYLIEGGKSVFELQSNTVEIMDMIIGGHRRGTRFGGYLIVVTDMRGEIIAYKTSSEKLFQLLENLRKVPVGKTFDKEGLRCMPTRPKRFY